MQLPPKPYFGKRFPSWIMRLSIILNQYFRLIHIVALTAPSNAQRYAVRRHYDAVLRGTVAAKDDGVGIVHNSTAIKNTSLQSVRAIMVMAMS